MVTERSKQQTSWASDRFPPLESGDHLTRHAFEQRYHAMPHLKKAELVAEIAASSAANDTPDSKPRLCRSHHSGYDNNISVNLL
jgi:hypothetical protein